MILTSKPVGRIPNALALPRLRIILAAGGIRAAVTFLNSLTDHRFTSLYRFDGPILHNLVFFDRENPNVENCPDIPVPASYCIFVRETGKCFSVHESKRDERVTGHPHRDKVQSYCGVPLLDRDLKMFGSICHYDFRPAHVLQQDIDLLESMAQLLAAHPKYASANGW